jgi:hypothetical protein
VIEQRQEVARVLLDRVALGREFAMSAAAPVVADHALVACQVGGEPVPDAQGCSPAVDEYDRYARAGVFVRVLVVQLDAF